MRSRRRISLVGLVCGTLALVAAARADLVVQVTAPAALNTNAASDSIDDTDTAITTDQLGNWVTLWYSGSIFGGGDILVARSADNGATWTPPTSLGSNANIAPEIATDGLGNWVAVWESFDSLGGTIGGDSDILVARSVDNGATWTAPAALNTNAVSDSGSDIFPAVTTDGLGNWVATWGSSDDLGGTIGTDSDILVARSTDNGATWTTPAALNTNAATDSGSDFLPRLATDSLGNWVTVWTSRDSLGGTIGTDRDVLVARSTDNGLTWTAPSPLYDATVENDTDVSQRIATDGLGCWLAVWESDNSLGSTIGGDSDILVTHSTDNGVTWSAPAPLNTNASTDDVNFGHDRDPDIATDGLGNWVAVWQSAAPGGTDLDVVMAHSDDNGATWSPLTPLNTNAEVDSGSDAQPRVTTDGLGNWVAAWESNEAVVGSGIGTDNDILVTQLSSHQTDVVPAVDAMGVVGLAVVLLLAGMAVLLSRRPAVGKP